MFPPLLLSLPFFFLLPAELALAQTSNVSCAAATWTYNSLSQTPCVVASVLQANCQGGDAEVFIQDLDSLNWGSYVGPFFADEPPLFGLHRCLCTSQMWNLLAACTESCQGHEMQPWDVYTATCNDSYTGEDDYPKETFDASQIPDATEIPPWANLPPPSAGPFRWDEAAAERNASDADSTTTRSSRTSTDSSEPTESAPSDDDGGSSTPTGAIVGGVLGGLAVIGALVLAGLWLFRRRDARHGAPSRRSSMYYQQSDIDGGVVAPYPWMNPSLAGSPPPLDRVGSASGPTPPRPAPTAPSSWSSRPQHPGTAPSPLPLPWESAGAPVPEMQAVAAASSPSPGPGIRYYGGAPRSMGDLSHPSR